MTAGVPGRLGVRSRQVRQPRRHGAHLRFLPLPRSGSTPTLRDRCRDRPDRGELPRRAQDRPADPGNRRARAVRVGDRVAAALLGGNASIDNLSVGVTSEPLGVLRSAGLLFFAFAGYARIATLGEEVRDPERSIPRAIPIALGIVVVVYAIVMGTVLLAVGPERLAQAPLATAVESGRWVTAVPLVCTGTAIAAAGVLLSLLAGVSRTALAMTRHAEQVGAAGESRSSASGGG